MQRRIDLPSDRMPTAWYNVLADMTGLPEPYLHPGTRQPIGPDDLSPIFPMALIEQEVTTQRYVEIPGEVIEAYRQWRPTPLGAGHAREDLLQIRRSQPGRKP
jgi:tryptophan synthase beta chain